MNGQWALLHRVGPMVAFSMLDPLPLREYPRAGCSAVHGSPRAIHGNQDLLTFSQLRREISRPFCCSSRVSSGLTHPPFSKVDGVVVVG